jgi:hypothetical protein
LDAGLFKELPNEFAAFGAVVIQALVRPLTRDQHPPPGDAQVFELVGFAFAAPGRHGMPSTPGLDPIEQPHRTLR